MNILEDNEPAEYYRTLVVSEDSRVAGAVQKCLKACAHYFRERGAAIHIDGGYLTAEPGSDDYGISITLYYWHEEENEVLDRKQFAGGLPQHGLSTLDPEALAGEQYIPERGLGMLFVRLPTGGSQDSFVRLAETAAHELEELGPCRILDLVVHPFSDENGIDHPYVRIYFQR